MTPPIIGAAIRFITSAPAPWLHMIGSKPTRIAITVIIFGRMRFTAPLPRIPSLCQSSNLFSLSALLITETELKVMATLAITGLNNVPKKG